MDGDSRETALARGSPVRVCLVKQRGPDVQYPAVVTFDDGTHIIVRGTWSEPKARDLGFVRFEPGDVFLEHYWRDRWYSVKEVRSADGEMKGWYCDVARPVRLHGSLLVSEDLDLDLWVSADRGTILRLDEEDFRSSDLAHKEPLAEAEARRALEQLAVMGEAGFSQILEGTSSPSEARSPAPSALQSRIERTIAALYHSLESNRVSRVPWATIQTFSRAQGALLSGSMAYYTFLSLLPLLLVAAFVLGSLSHSNPRLQAALADATERLFPGVQGHEIINQLVRARVTFGVVGLVLVSVAGSGFVGALTACLNRMWEVAAGRNPVSQKLVNLLAVLLLGSVLLGSVALTIWVQYATRAALGSSAGPLPGLIELVAGPLSLFAVLILVYRLLPHRHLSWRSQVPGALFGAIGTELLKRGFTLWTQHSAGVAALPRSLLSVVLLLLWLGFFAQVVLYGAALNVVLGRRRQGRSLLPLPD